MSKKTNRNRARELKRRRAARRKLGLSVLGIGVAIFVVFAAVTSGAELRDPLSAFLWHIDDMDLGPEAHTTTTDPLCLATKFKALSNGVDLWELDCFEADRTHGKGGMPERS